jgi:hypothetical protein
MTTPSFGMKSSMPDNLGFAISDSRFAIANCAHGFENVRANSRITHHQSQIDWI